jgi:hypothetical protein
VGQDSQRARENRGSRSSRSGTDVWTRSSSQSSIVSRLNLDQIFANLQQTIDYGDGTTQDAPDAVEGPKAVDEGSPVRVSKRAQLDEDNDTDFQADSDEESVAAEEEIEDVVDAAELQIPDQPKPASKLIRPSGKELSLKTTPTKPRKSPKKIRITVSTPKKKAASTPKKKKRDSTATPGSVTRRAQTPFTPGVFNGRKARETQMNMQQYGSATAAASFIDLTADSGDEVYIVGVQQLAPPPQQTEDEEII